MKLSTFAALVIAGLPLGACTVIFGNQGSCEYLGHTYEDGESWQCDCNQCTCRDGEVASTMMACWGGGGGIVYGTGGGPVGTGGWWYGTGGSGATATGGVLTYGGAAPTGGALPNGGAQPLGGGDAGGSDAGGAEPGGTEPGGAAGSGAGGAVSCGGRFGDPCTDREYCAYVPGELCGAADAASVCLPRPLTCDMAAAPVCGCDGQTYTNACVANGSGTGILSDGPC